MAFFAIRSRLIETIHLVLQDLFFSGAETGNGFQSSDFFEFTRLEFSGLRGALGMLVFTLSLVVWVGKAARGAGSGLLMAKGSRFRVRAALFSR